MGPHMGLKSSLKRVDWGMSSIPSVSSGNGFIGYRQGIFLGRHTGFTPVSVKWEMGNVVNALDVEWSIALRGIVN